MDTLVVFDRHDYDLTWKRFDRYAGRSVICKNGLYAMVYSRQQGYYKFPGGGLDAGETPVDAMIRETQEESGLIVDPDTIVPIGIVKEIRRGLKEPEIFSHTSYYYYAGIKDETSEAKPVGYEVTEEIELRWVHLEEAIAETEPRLEHMRGDFLRRELFIMKKVLQDSQK